MLAMLLVVVMVSSVMSQVVTAKKPARISLVVGMTGPVDGLIVENRDSFTVSGTVESRNGDAGYVEAFVQFSLGAGTSSFVDITGQRLEILTGLQPQASSILNGEQYSVTWSIAGEPGVYEIRIYCVSSGGLEGESTSATVTIKAPPPPAGTYFPTGEYQDPDTGFGSTTGSYIDTLLQDGIYEILREEVNTQGTKKPVDDITELGWIFEFAGLGARTQTTLNFFGHVETTASDSDTGFDIQLDYYGIWVTVFSLKSGLSDSQSAVDIYDDLSSSIRIRFIDNDRTAGNAEISKVLVDCLFISNNTITPPPSKSSGIEILYAPYMGSNFKVWEYNGTTWYHAGNYAITAAGATDIKIVDLDLDGNNEVVVAETRGDNNNQGIIEIFDFDIGITPIQTLVLPPEFPVAVTSLAVRNFDWDPYLEILCGLAAGGAIMWDRVGGTYVLAQIFPDSYIVNLVAAGDFDADPEYEFVMAAGWNPREVDVVLYDFDGTSWMNVANYSGFSSPGDGFGDLKTCDFNMDGIDEVVVSYHNDPLRVLSYLSGQLVCTWTSPFIYSTLGFSVGNITNNGKLDILLRSPYPETKLMYFEYQDGSFVNIGNISVPGMEGVYNGQISIGDLDADGLNEFVVGDGPGGIYSQGHLWIFRGYTLLYDTIVAGNDANVVTIGDYDNDA